MKLWKSFLLMTVAMTGVLTACSSDSSEEVTTLEDAIDVQNTEEVKVESSVLDGYTQDNESLVFDSTSWNYDQENDVYWQIGVSYSSNPETLDYETMGIYVPGAYMTSVENGDGTYTCTINLEGEVGGYTAETAPIVFPVNTAGYSAQAAPTSYSYSGLSSYLESGFIYVYAGMRGRSNGYDEAEDLTYSGGAPWGVTDLKAAVRYYRFNEDILPGDTERVFTLGHSGGGAQSALMGATGDSELYYDYLVSIGAAMYDEDGNYISDAIMGAMSWCPITNLDYADAAYEWNMGQYSTTGTRSDETWTSALSADLADAYAAYINELGLTDESGTILLLSDSESGIYTSGTYYDYLLSVIENSLENFLSDTTFPYSASGGMSQGDAGFGGGGGMPSGQMPEGATTNREMPDGAITDGQMPDGAITDGEMPMGEGGKNDKFSNQMGESEATTYETAQDYIDSLNADEVWVNYDATTNSVSITSIEAFVNHCKNASKNVAAFDDLNRTQAENMLFGNDDQDAAHFDTVLANLLQTNAEKYATYSDWDASITEAYLTDLVSVDALKNDLETRQNMYNPMYYISDYYEGYQTSTLAPYWRIHSGIEQGDTALTTELNLALALSQNDAVEDVEFETVWEQGHTTAERTGNSTDNFIQWVNECLN